MLFWSTLFNLHLALLNKSGLQTFLLLFLYLCSHVLTDMYTHTWANNAFIKQAAINRMYTMVENECQIIIPLRHCFILSYHISMTAFFHRLFTNTERHVTIPCSYLDMRLGKVYVCINWLEGFGYQLYIHVSTYCGYYILWVLHDNERSIDSSHALI